MPKERPNRTGFSLAKEIINLHAAYNPSPIYPETPAVFHIPAERLEIASKTLPENDSSAFTQLLLSALCIDERGGISGLEMGIFLNKSKSGGKIKLESDLGKVDLRFDLDPTGLNKKLSVDRSDFIELSFAEGSHYESYEMMSIFDNYVSALTPENKLGLISFFVNIVKSSLN